MGQSGELEFKVRLGLESAIKQAEQLKDILMKSVKPKTSDYNNISSVIDKITKSAEAMRDKMAESFKTSSGTKSLLKEYSQLNGLLQGVGERFSHIQDNNLLLSDAQTQQIKNFKSEIADLEKSINLLQSGKISNIFSKGTGAEFEKIRETIADLGGDITKISFDDVANHLKSSLDKTNNEINETSNKLKQLQNITENFSSAKLQQTLDMMKKNNNVSTTTTVKLTGDDLEKAKEKLQEYNQALASFGIKAADERKLQNQSSTFIQRETQRIDAAFQDQQKLIQEKREAINSALTSMKTADDKRAEGQALSNKDLESIINSDIVKQAMDTIGAQMSQFDTSSIQQKFTQIKALFNQELSTLITPEALEGQKQQLMSSIYSIFDGLGEETIAKGKVGAFKNNIASILKTFNLDFDTLGIDASKFTDGTAVATVYQTIIDAVQNYSQALQNSGITEQDASAKMEALAATAKVFEAALQQVNSAQENSGQTIGEYEAKITSLNGSMNEVFSAAMRLMGLSFDKIFNPKPIDDGSKAINSYLNNLLKLDQRQKNLSNIQMAISRWMGFYQVLNLTKRAVSSMKQHITELDTVMTKIAVVTNMSQDNLWGQIGKYSEIARQYGVAIKGVYEVSQLYYQQGLQKGDVMNLTQETLKMARIAGIEYSTAADYMTTAIRGFKLEMSDASHVTDVFSNLAANTASSTEELAIAISKTAASAASVGSSFESTSAMMATMISTTRESATNIGTALKSIISRYGEMKENLTGKDAEGEEYSLNKVDKALQSVGITLHNTTGQFRNFDDVILELASAWDSIDTNTQRYIATVMAGNRQQSRFLSLVSNVDEYKRALDLANNSEGTGDIQTLKTLDSVDAKVEKLKVTIQEFYTSSGIQDLYKGILDTVTNVINAGNKLPKLFDVIPVQALSIGANVVSVIKTLLLDITSSIKTQMDSLMGEGETKFQAFATKIGTYLSRAIKKGAEDGSNAANQALNTVGTTTPGSSKTGLATVLRYGGMAATLLGTSMQIGAMSKYGSSKSAQEDYNAGSGMLLGSLSSIAGGTLSGAASGAMMGAAGGPFGALGGAILGGAMSLISNLGSIISGVNMMSTDLARQIELSKKDLEEKKQKETELKGEAKDLEVAIAKYKELEAASHSSNEAMQEFINYQQQLADTYPYLIDRMELNGDKIIQLADLETTLAETRSKASQATVNTIQSEKETLEKQQMAYQELSNGLSNLLHGNFEFNDTSWLAQTLGGTPYFGGTGGTIDGELLSNVLARGDFEEYLVKAYDTVQEFNGEAYLAAYDGTDDFHKIFEDNKEAILNYFTDYLKNSILDETYAVPETAESYKKLLKNINKQLEVPFEELTKMSKVKSLDDIDKLNADELHAAIENTVKWVQEQMDKSDLDLSAIQDTLSDAQLDSAMSDYLKEHTKSNLNDYRSFVEKMMSLQWGNVDWTDNVNKDPETNLTNAEVAEKEFAWWDGWLQTHKADADWLMEEFDYNKIKSASEVSTALADHGIDNQEIRNKLIEEYIKTQETIEEGYTDAITKYTSTASRSTQNQLKNLFDGNLRGYELTSELAQQVQKQLPQYQKYIKNNQTLTGENYLNNIVDFYKAVGSKPTSDQNKIADIIKDIDFTDAEKLTSIADQLREAGYADLADQLNSAAQTLGVNIVTQAESLADNLKDTIKEIEGVTEKIGKGMKFSDAVESAKKIMEKAGKDAEGMSLMETEDSAGLLKFDETLGEYILTANGIRTWISALQKDQTEAQEQLDRANTQESAVLSQLKATDLTKEKITKDTSADDIGKWSKNFVQTQELLSQLTGSDAFTDDESKRYAQEVENLVGEFLKQDELDWDQFIASKKDLVDSTMAFTGAIIASTTKNSILAAISAQDFAGIAKGTASNETKESLKVLLDAAGAKIDDFDAMYNELLIGKLDTLDKALKEAGGGIGAEVKDSVEQSTVQAYIKAIEEYTDPTGKISNATQALVANLKEINPELDTTNAAAVIQELYTAITTGVLSEFTSTGQQYSALMNIVKGKQKEQGIGKAANIVKAAEGGFTTEELSTLQTDWAIEIFDATTGELKEGLQQVLKLDENGVYQLNLDELSPEDAIKTLLDFFGKELIDAGQAGLDAIDQAVEDARKEAETKDKTSKSISQLQNVASAKIGSYISVNHLDQKIQDALGAKDGWVKIATEAQREDALMALTITEGMSEAEKQTILDIQDTLRTQKGNKVAALSGIMSEHVGVDAAKAYAKTIDNDYVNNYKALMEEIGFTWNELTQQFDVGENAAQIITNLQAKINEIRASGDITQNKDLQEQVNTLETQLTKLKNSKSVQQSTALSNVLSNYESVTEEAIDSLATSLGVPIEQIQKYFKSRGNGTYETNVAALIVDIQNNTFEVVEGVLASLGDTIKSAMTSFAQAFEGDTEFATKTANFSEIYGQAWKLWNNLTEEQQKNFDSISDLYTFDPESKAFKLTDQAKEYQITSERDRLLTAAQRQKDLTESLVSRFEYYQNTFNKEMSDTAFEKWLEVHEATEDSEYFKSLRTRWSQGETADSLRQEANALYEKSTANIYEVYGNSILQEIAKFDFASIVQGTANEETAKANLKTLLQQEKTITDEEMDSIYASIADGTFGAYKELLADTDVAFDKIFTPEDERQFQRDEYEQWSTAFNEVATKKRGDWSKATLQLYDAFEATTSEAKNTEFLNKSNTQLQTFTNIDTEQALQERLGVLQDFAGTGIETELYKVLSSGEFDTNALKSIFEQYHRLGDYANLVDQSTGKFKSDLFDGWEYDESSGMIKAAITSADQFKTAVMDIGNSVGISLDNLTNTADFAKKTQSVLSNRVSQLNEADTDQQLAQKLNDFNSNFQSFVDLSGFDSDLLDAIAGIGDGIIRDGNAFKIMTESARIQAMNLIAQSKQFSTKNTKAQKTATEITDKIKTDYSKTSAIDKLTSGQIDKAAAEVIRIAFNYQGTTEEFMSSLGYQLSSDMTAYDYIGGEVNELETFIRNTMPEETEKQKSDKADAITAAQNLYKQTEKNTKQYAALQDIITNRNEVTREQLDELSKTLDTSTNQLIQDFTTETVSRNYKFDLGKFRTSTTGQQVQQSMWDRLEPEISTVYDAMTDAVKTAVTYAFEGTNSQQALTDLQDTFKEAGLELSDNDTYYDEFSKTYKLKLDALNRVKENSIKAIAKSTGKSEEDVAQDLNDYSKKIAAEAVDISSFISAEHREVGTSAYHNFAEQLRNYYSQVDKLTGQALESKVSNMIDTFEKGGPGAVTEAQNIAKTKGITLTNDEIQAIYAPAVNRLINYRDSLTELSKGSYIAEGEFRNILIDAGIVDAQTGLVTSVDNLASAYLGIYSRMTTGANGIAATLQQKNDTYAKYLTATEQGDIDAVSAMGQAVSGMSYETLGQILGKNGQDLRTWLQTNQRLYTPLGAGQVRLTNFKAFADQMGWKPGSEKYNESFKAYNEAMVELDKKNKTKIKDDLSKFTDIKPGDEISLSDTWNEVTFRENEILKDHEAALQLLVPSGDVQTEAQISVEEAKKRNEQRQKAQDQLISDLEAANVSFEGGVAVAKGQIDNEKLAQAWKNYYTNMGHEVDASTAQILDTIASQNKSKLGAAYSEMISNWQAITPEMIQSFVEAGGASNYEEAKQLLGLKNQGNGTYELGVREFQDAMQSTEIADITKDAILQQVSELADTALQNITTASSLVTQGTTNQADMQKFLTSAKQLGIDAEGAFSYDSILNAWTLNATTMGQYIQAQAQQLVNDGLLSAEEVNDYVNKNVAQTLANVVDIKAFLDAENKQGQARQKLAKQLKDAGIYDSNAGRYSENYTNYLEQAAKELGMPEFTDKVQARAKEMAKQGQEFNDKVRDATAEQFIQTIEKGGLAAVQAMQSLASIQGKELTAADIESAYRSQVSQIEKASDQLTSSVGSLVSGKVIDILNNANYTLEKIEGTNSAVITSIGDVSVAYANYYQSLKNSNEATLEQLNNAYAKVLETKDGRKKEQSAIDALGSAAGMTFETLGAIFAEANLSLEDNLQILESSGMIEAIGGNKLRIKDFTAFAKAMKWDLTSEEAVSAFKTYNDSMIDLNHKAEKNVINEVKALESAKGGDWLNLTQFSDMFYKAMAKPTIDVKARLKELADVYGEGTQAYEEEAQQLIKTKQETDAFNSLILPKLNNELVQVHANLENGILKMENNADLLGVFGVLNNAIQKMQQSDNFDFGEGIAELQDSMNNMVKSYVDLVSNGLSGSLSNADFAKLSQLAQANNLEPLQYKNTAEGLQLTEDSFFNLYGILSKTNKLMLKKLLPDMTKISSKYSNLGDAVDAFERSLEKGQHDKNTAEQETLADLLRDMFTNPDSYNLMDYEPPKSYQAANNYYTSQFQAYQTSREMLKGTVGYDEYTSLMQSLLHSGDRTAGKRGLDLLQYGMGYYQIDANGQPVIDTKSMYYDLKQRGIIGKEYSSYSKWVDSLYTDWESAYSKIRNMAFEQQDAYNTLLQGSGELKFADIWDKGNEINEKKLSNLLKEDSAEAKDISGLLDSFTAGGKTLTELAKEQQLGDEGLLSLVQRLAQTEWDWGNESQQLSDIFKSIGRGAEITYDSKGKLSVNILEEGSGIEIIHKTADGHKFKGGQYAEYLSNTVLQDMQAAGEEITFKDVTMGGQQGFQTEYTLQGYQITVTFLDDLSTVYSAKAGNNTYTASNYSDLMAAISVGEHQELSSLSATPEKSKITMTIDGEEITIVYTIKEGKVEIDKEASTKSNDPAFQAKIDKAQQEFTETIQKQADQNLSETAIEIQSGIKAAFTGESGTEIGKSFGASLIQGVAEGVSEDTGAAIGTAFNDALGQAIANKLDGGEIVEKFNTAVSQVVKEGAQLGAAGEAIPIKTGDITVEPSNIKLDTTGSNTLVSDIQSILSNADPIPVKITPVPDEVNPFEGQVFEVKVKMTPEDQGQSKNNNTNTLSGLNIQGPVNQKIVSGEIEVPAKVKPILDQQSLHSISKETSLFEGGVNVPVNVVQGKGDTKQVVKSMIGEQTYDVSPNFLPGEPPKLTGWVSYDNISFRSAKPPTLYGTVVYTSTFRGGGCFVAGTQIIMSDYTMKNIEDIEVGEQVIAYNDENHQFEARTVTKSYNHYDTPRVLEITLSNGVILGTTPGHPILTTTGWKSRDIANSRWEHNTEADWLNLGDEVIGYFGNAKVLAIKELDIPEHYTTYNIEVETCHTFLADGIVVHNMKAKAAGNVGLAHAKSTLMGELGPEMVVSNNRYYIVGQDGPEFVDLKDDAIVFNHLQTRQLLKHGHTPTHGRAVTSESEAAGMAHAYTKEQLEARNKKKEEDTAAYRKREAEKREAEAKAKQAKAEEKAAIIAANQKQKEAQETQRKIDQKKIEVMKSANAGADALAQLTELKKQAANNLNLTDAERNELAAKIKQLETDKKNDIELYRALKQTYDPKVIEEAEKELAKASKGQSDAANKMNNAAGNMNNAAGNINDSAENLNTSTLQAPGQRNEWASQELPRGGLISPDNKVHPGGARIFDAPTAGGGGGGGGHVSYSRRTDGTLEGNTFAQQGNSPLATFINSKSGGGGGGADETSVKDAKSAVSSFLSDLLSKGASGINLDDYEKMPADVRGEIQNKILQGDSYRSFIDRYAGYLSKGMEEVNAQYLQAWQKDLEEVGLGEEQMEALEGLSFFNNGEISGGGDDWKKLLGSDVYFGDLVTAGILEWNPIIRQYVVKSKEDLENFGNTQLGVIWNFNDALIDGAVAVTEEINDLIAKATSNEGISEKDKSRLLGLLDKQGYTDSLDFVTSGKNKNLLSSDSALKVTKSLHTFTNAVATTAASTLGEAGEEVTVESDINEELAPIYDAIYERIKNSVDYIKNLIEGTSNFEDFQSLKDNLLTLDLGIYKDEINKNLQYEKTENGLQLKQSSLDWLIKVLSKDYPERVEELIKTANETYFKNWEDDMEKASKDAMKQMKYYSGGGMSGGSSDWNNLLGGKIQVSELVARGILTYNEKLNTYVASSIEEIKKLGLNPDILDESVIKDGIDQLFEEILSNFSKAMSEGLSNVEMNQFIENLHLFGVDLNLTFKQTVDGLKLASESAIELYFALQKVDSIQAQLYFKKLNESLKESNDHYKNATTILAHIKELQDKINDAEHYSDEKIKQYKEELTLAKEILAVRTTSEDDSFDVANRELPAGMKNALTYANSIATIAREFREAFETEEGSGIIDYQMFYNMATEINNAAAYLGTSIDFFGYTLDGGIDSLDNVITHAANSLGSSADGNKIGVSLEKFGENIVGGMDDFASSADTAMHTMAKVQIEILDGLIAMFEVIVAMEEFEGVDTDKNGLLDLNEIFDLTGLSEEAQKTATKFNKEFSDAASNILAAINSDEKWKKVADSIKLNGHTITELLEAGVKGTLDLVDVTAEEYQKMLSVIYEKFKSGDFDINDIYNSLKENFMINDSNWDGTIEINDIVLNVKYGVQLTKTEEGYVTPGGATYPDTKSAAQGLALEAIGGTDVTFDPITVTSSGTLHIGESNIEVTVSTDGSEAVTYNAPSGTYTKLNDAIKGEWQAARDRGETTLDLKEWEIDQKIKVIPVVSPKLAESDLQLDQSQINAAIGKTYEEIEAEWDAAKGNKEAELKFQATYGVAFNDQTTEEDWARFKELAGITTQNIELNASINLVNSDPTITQLLSGNAEDHQTAINVSAVVDAAQQAMNTLKTDINNTQGTVTVNANTSTAEQETEALKNYINGTYGTVQVDASTSAAQDKLDSILEAIDKIDTSIDIDVNINQNGEFPSASGSTSAKGNVAGLAMASGTQTLMGELGPELYVSNGRYHLVGEAGAEFVNLPDDAIVFNHLQTERLLASGSAGRGKPVTNEQNAVAMARGTTGPAAANARETLAALKQMKAMWQSIANMSVTELAGHATDNGKENIATWFQQLEKWFTLMQKIATLEKEITREQKIRAAFQSKLVAQGDKYADSLVRSVRQLTEELDLQQQLAESHLQEYNKLRSEINSDSPFNKFFTFDEKGQIIYTENKANKELFLKILNTQYETNELATKMPQQQVKWAEEAGLGRYMKTDSEGKDIVQEEGESDSEFAARKLDALKYSMDTMQGKIQGEYDAWFESINNALDLEAERNKILQEIRDNQLSLEEKILTSIEEREQAIIDKLTDERTALSNASEKYIKGLEDTLSKERKLYEKNNETKELETLQRRLSILQRSGGPQSEIANLQEEIQEKSQDLYFDTQQEQIDAVREASDLQLEKLQTQIDLMTETLEYSKEHGLLWAEVNEVLKGTSEEITSFITGNMKDWQSKSTLAQEEEQKEILFIAQEFNQLKEYGDELSQNMTDAVTDKLDEVLTATEIVIEKQETKTETEEKVEPVSTTISSNANIGESTSNKNSVVTYDTLSKTTKNLKALKERWISINQQINDLDKEINDLQFKKQTGKISSVDKALLNTRLVKKLELEKERNTLKETLGYIHGGMVTETGLVKVHGTDARPEAFMNADEVQMWKQEILGNSSHSLLGQMLEIRSLYDSISGVSDSITHNTDSIIIEHAEVNMNVEQLANDYDARRAGEVALEEMVRIARKQGMNNVRR